MFQKLRLLVRGCRTSSVSDTPSLFHLTWPIFVELALQLLVGNVDQFMLSQYSQNSVAAVGNANQILNVLTLTFSFISLASTILIAQYIGSGNREKVSEVCTLSVVVNGVFGLIVSGILLAFGRSFFVWMKVPEELMTDSLAYLNILSAALVFQSLYMSFAAVFKSHARMRETMVTSVFINVANIVGNFLLISGPGPFPALGAAGAAIASDFSRLGGLLMLIFLFRREIDAKISLKLLRPFPFGQLKRLLMIGVPSGGETLLYNISQLCILSFVNTFGTMVITTRMYCGMIAMISYLYGSAISQGAQILVGYLIGGKKLEEADQTVRKTLVMSILAGVSLSAVLYLCSNFIFGMFTSDPGILALAKKIMAVEIVLELGRAVNLVLVCALQAAGDIKFPVSVGILSMWLIAVLFSYLFGVQFGWGIVGIWWAMAMDECLRGVIFIFRWLGGKWKAKQLI